MGKKGLVDQEEKKNTSLKVKALESRHLLGIFNV